MKVSLPELFCYLMILLALVCFALIRPVQTPPLAALKIDPNTPAVEVFGTPATPLTDGIECPQGAQFCRPAVTIAVGENDVVLAYYNGKEWIYPKIGANRFAFDRESFYIHEPSYVFPDKCPKTPRKTRPANR